MFTALHTLNAPGTLVAGYRRGEPVDPSVVEAWGLTVGEDVTDGPLEESERVVAVPRPGPEANRAAWESYAVANGMSEEDAGNASQEDLEGVEPEPEVVQAGRPADNARKAEWVSYVSDHPQATDEDKAWAGDDTTTKADLQGWKPVGDPVALAATEATHGA